MKVFFALLFVSLLAPLTAGAKSLPDCSAPGFDADARTIGIPRSADAKLIFALEVISDLEQRFIIASSYFPIFSRDTVTISFKIIRTNDDGIWLNHSLEAIASIEGAKIGCLPLLFDET